jgi:hypothetical protein
MFSDNSSQVQALHALRYLSLKAELEVASIISISKRDNGSLAHACMLEHSPIKQALPSLSADALAMAISPAMFHRNQLFPPSPNFPPPMFHEQSVFTFQTPSDQDCVQ